MILHGSLALRQPSNDFYDFFIGKGEIWHKYFKIINFWIWTYFAKKCVETKSPKLCLKLFYKKMTGKCETIFKKRFKKKFNTKYFCTPLHTDAYYKQKLLFFSDTQKKVHTRCFTHLYVSKSISIQKTWVAAFFACSTLCVWKTCSRRRG